MEREMKDRKRVEIEREKCVRGGRGGGRSLRVYQQFVSSDMALLVDLNKFTSSTRLCMLSFDSQKPRAEYTV